MSTTLITMARHAKRTLRRTAAASICRVRPGLLAVFNYHQVSRRFDPKYHRSATWTALEHFERELEILRSRFRIRPLAEALADLRAGALRVPTAAITIDDGDRSVERDLIPVLREHRVPATLFVNSGYWAQQRAHWVYLFEYLAQCEDPIRRDRLAARRDDFRRLRETRDPAEYRRLVAEIEALADGIDPDDALFVSRDYLAGLEPELFAIGLHGHEHQRFAMMPEAWQRRAIDANVEHLADLPGYQPIFAIPFGRPHDWDDTVLRLCRERGLEVMTADGGVNRRVEACWRRIPADGRRVWPEFQHQLVGW